MKKRMLAIMMSALMAAGVCSGVTVYADADSKTLTVGFDAEYPPFGYMDENGEYVGFDLDIAQKVCDNLGWELVKKPINWDSKDMELNSGNIDCIWNGFTINGREDDYTWSDPYLNNEQVMVVASDSGIDTLADLAGKNVVVQAASAALDALNSDDNKDLTDSFGSLTENPDYNTAFMNIDSGAADAVAVDIGVAKYQLAQREEGKYKILDEPIQSEQYGIGFAKGNEELRDTVWAEVMKLYEDGEIDKLAEQYGVADMLCLVDEDSKDAEDENADTEEAADAETEDAAEDEAGIEVTSLPGPAACITALTLSGLSTRRFAFEAFLPPDKKERKAILEELKSETRTIILYEAPHHLVGTLEELYETLGNRRMTLCRELTKKHETAFCSTIKDLLDFYQDQKPLGECVLVIEGKSREEIREEEKAAWEEMSISQHMEVYEKQGIARKEAMKLVAKDRGVTKREIYQALLEIK